MVEYKLEVATGDMLLAGTYDNVYITLIGTDGESERINSGQDLMFKKLGTYTVTAPSPLGRLLLLRLEKEQFLFLPENQWFLSKIVVTTPESDVIMFPCYRWVSRGEVVELRGGKASKVFEDELPLLVEQRKKELEFQRKLYQWLVYAEGLPQMNSASDISALPAGVLFSISKTAEIEFTKATTLIELQVKGLAESTEQWKDLEEMKKVFFLKKTPISEYVSEHWKEDDFFGSQFLNGNNPNVIQVCKQLPPNFPVTDEMVKPFLEDGSSLNTEMAKGNIFLCDYKRLEDLPTRVINNEPLPLTPALCLFYNNPEKKLLPIAIQLGQKPSENNTIFLPSDSEHDWLLAKMFVRNADFIEHQFSYYLLRTHFLAEAFAVATFRNLPMMHPIYKLLIPHFRHTLHVNILSRERLFGPSGALTNETSVGVEGMIELMKRSQKEILRSLFLPEDIAARGLESIPDYHYRDDGMKLWNIINSFVKGMVEYFYPTDSEVSRDSELQEWREEIFTYGFLSDSNSDKHKLQKVEEVIAFITMIIFTVSAQHSAASVGQFDYCGWAPNSPSLLRKAPPTTKGSSSKVTILETLPDVGTTVRNMASLWLVSKRYSDFVPLGSYPDLFEEDPPKQIIKKLQTDLTFLNTLITERNAGLALPYNYMNPAEMENSVSK